jgi:hypothetical protein
MKKNTRKPMVTLVLEEFGREFKPKSHYRRMTERGSMWEKTKNSQLFHKDIPTGENWGKRSPL